MAILPKIFPNSPDPYIQRLGSNKSTTALARLAHINALIDQVNINTTNITTLVTESPIYYENELIDGQIQKMGVSPIMIVAPPGVGSYIEVAKCVLEYTYNGVPFTLADSLALKLNTTTIYSIPASLITDAKSSFILVGGTYVLSAETNSALYITTVANSNPGNNGTGHLQIKLWYYIRTLG